MRAGVRMQSVGVAMCVPPELALTRYRHVPVPIRIRLVALATTGIQVTLVSLLFS